MIAGDEIRRLRVVASPGPDQVQPNGIDLSLDAAWCFADRGALGAAAESRRLSDRQDLEFDADGWLELGPGGYGIRYAEWVEMPADWTVVLDGVATSVLWFTILKLVLTCPRRSCPA